MIIKEFAEGEQQAIKNIAGFGLKIFNSTFF